MNWQTNVNMRIQRVRDNCVCGMERCVGEGQGGREGGGISPLVALWVLAANATLSYYTITDGWLRKLFILAVFLSPPTPTSWWYCCCSSLVMWCNGWHMFCFSSPTHLHAITPMTQSNKTKYSTYFPTSSSYSSSPSSSLFFVLRKLRVCHCCFCVRCYLCQEVWCCKYVAVLRKYGSGERWWAVCTRSKLFNLHFIFP